MEQVRNGKKVRDGKPLSAWKRSVMSMSVAAVLACVGGAVHAQMTYCNGNSPSQVVGGAIVCGQDAEAKQTGAIAIGTSARTGGTNAVALGATAQALAADSLAFGANAIVDTTAIGSIALGAGSHATGTSAEKVTYLTQTTTVTKELAIGNRRISGVADGANNDDAATIGQLKAANIGNDRAVRYDWKDTNDNKIVDPGEVTYKTVTMGVDPQTGKAIAGGVVISNVASGDVSETSTQAVNGAQLLGVKQTAEAANLAANAGWTVTDANGRKANIGPNDTVTFKSPDTNLAVTQTGTNDAGVVEVKLAENLNLGPAGSVAMGATTVNAGGLTITGGPSVTTAGINAGTKQVTNVAAGVALTDAVNKSQLDAVSGSANAGWNVTDASGNKANIGPNDTVTFKSPDANLVVTQTGKDDAGVVEVGLAKNVDLGAIGSVTIGGTAVNAAGLAIAGGPSVTTAGINAGTKQVTNVAAGVALTDAVNKSQLDAVSGSANAGWNVTDASGNKANIGPNDTVTFKSPDTNLVVTQTGKDDAGVVEVKLAQNLDLSAEGSVLMGTTMVNANGLTIIGGPSVTTTGINAGSKLITNVLAGVASTDAVNKSQLDAVSGSANAGWNVTDAYANNAKIGPNDTVTFKSPDTNLVVTQTGKDDAGVVEVELAKNVDLGASGSVTMGDTVVNANGLIIANGPSVTATGIDAGNMVITHVAAGKVSDTSTDAVNGSQLYATNQAIETISSVAGNANDLAVKYGWNDANGDGIATQDEIDYNTVTLQGSKGTTIDNVAPAFLDPSSMQAVNGGQLFQSMSQVASMLGGGASMTENGLTAPTYFIQGSVYNDVGSALQALDVTVSLLDGRPYGGTQLAGYTHARDGQYSPTGDGGAGSTALGVGARATGVEDAVAVGENAMVGADHGTAVGQGAAAMAEGSVALGQASVADRANTVSVGSAGNERQITNVADATQGTDAINKRQLDRGVASANSYTDARVNALSDSFELFQGAVDDRLRKQDRRIDRQGAMGSAMMNMAVSAAGVRTPNRVGVGVGFQGGESALSVGYQRAFSDRATLTFGGAVSSDDTSVGVGAGFGW